MIIIGVDESGTGAWAGPFTVCALALNDEHDARLRAAGVTDSKRLTDGKRRALVTDIIDTAIIGACVVVTVQDINTKGNRGAWREAIFTSIEYVSSRVLPPYSIVVDGNADPWLVAKLKIAGLSVDFRPRADSLVTAVSGASIIAKTMRNDAMLKIDEELPDYLWKKNYGYGTPEHMAAIKKYGRSVHHRNTENLIDVPMR